MNLTYFHPVLPNSIEKEETPTLKIMNEKYKLRAKLSLKRRMGVQFHGQLSGENHILAVLFLTTYPAGEQTHFGSLY